VKVYLDTSAAMKLVLDETETSALFDYLEQHSDAVPVSSILLETELRRAARRNLAVDDQVNSLLDLVNLVDAPRAVFRQAASLEPPALRSLDAIHLATALREDVDVFVVYDRILQDAARHAGLSVEAPA